ncbi:cell wall hydrolase [Erythrobacter westpacificensis]|uniref:cell wall hydrolase n=1 Tax=Erythrobacter westpacificensis TaxID=1055231 RepID=UPI0031F7A525
MATQSPLPTSNPERVDAPAAVSIADLNAFALRQVGPEAARLANVDKPMFDGPNPASQPFRTFSAGGVEFARALECLTQAVYYEAGRETEAGKRAVAQVVLNRVRHRDYPNSVCGVVYQGHTRSTGCQFTFTCDGSLDRAPSPAGWQHARRVAQAALNGAVFAPVGYATHYHADYVLPYWSPKLLKNAVIGAHIFYLLPGAAGQPGFFSASYDGVEPEFGGGLFEESDGPEAAQLDFETSTSFTGLGAILPSSKDMAVEDVEALDDFGMLNYRDDTQARVPLTARVGSAISTAKCRADPEVANSCSVYTSGSRELARRSENTPSSF